MSYAPLTKYIAKAVDTWYRDHPDLTAIQVLEALEELRHKLTEDLLKIRMAGPK